MSETPLGDGLLDDGSLGEGLTAGGPIDTGELPADNQEPDNEPDETGGYVEPEADHQDPEGTEVPEQNKHADEDA